MRLIFYKKLKSGAIDLAFGVIDVTNNMDIEYLEMTVESMGIVVPHRMGLSSRRTPIHLSPFSIRFPLLPIC